MVLMIGFIVNNEYTKMGEDFFLFSGCLRDPNILTIKG